MVKEVVEPFDWTFTTNYMGTSSARVEGKELQVMDG